MKIDILFLTFNRRQYTEFSLKHLIKNTDWSLVNKLVVYDDGSEDGTPEKVRLLLERTEGIDWEIREQPHTGSPVIVMNRYVANADSDWFAKIDSDIVVAPEWLPKMLSVIEKWPGTECLGMEPGRTRFPDPHQTEYEFQRARHIGGVGLIRTASLQGKPEIIANGRFGWTEFQENYKLMCGWIEPDLLMFSLDQLPLEPWAGLSAEYVQNGWQRAWGKYHPRGMKHYWSWAFPDKEQK